MFDYHSLLRLHDTHAWCKYPCPSRQDTELKSRGWSLPEQTLLKDAVLGCWGSPWKCTDLRSRLQSYFPCLLRSWRGKICNNLKTIEHLPTLLGALVGKPKWGAVCWDSPYFWRSMHTWAMFCIFFGTTFNKKKKKTKRAGNVNNGCSFLKCFGEPKLWGSQGKGCWGLPGWNSIPMKNLKVWHFLSYLFAKCPSILILVFRTLECIWPTWH